MTNIVYFILSQIKNTTSKGYLTVSFRKDINSLRACSVLAVISCHFYPNLLPGGFTAVDVFFVITGYLMTGIILKSLRNNQFSFLSFYLDRISRIIPPLCFLCFCLVIYGWYQLEPREFAETSKHVAGAISFVSNFMFWQEAGYFDTTSKDKWLLHTWTMSIDWQLYLLLPLLLLLAHQPKSLQRIKVIMVVITVLSFLISLKIGVRYPDANFYLLPGRLWEFTIGGCAWIYTHNREPLNSKWIQWVGYLLIAASFLFLETHLLWPGFYTIIPVFGAILVIIANRSEQKLLDHFAIQKIGLWSYSIYLWHWPVFVWLNKISIDGFAAILGISLSLFMGFFSYELIEKRRRRKLNVNFQDYFRSKSLRFLSVTLFLGSLIYFNQGFPSRYKHIEDIKLLVQHRNEAERKAKQFWQQLESNEFISVCSLDNSFHKLEDILTCLTKKFTSKGYLLVGDSHGKDFLHALNFAYPNEKFSMLYQSGCAPSTHTLSISANHHCFAMLDDINRLFIQQSENIKGLIFVSGFLNETGFKVFMSDIKQKKYGDIPIYISTISPLLDAPIIEMALKAGNVREIYSLGSSNKATMAKNEQLKMLGDKVKIFDKHSVFCEKDKCQLIEEKYPYIWDTSHLSEKGIKKLAESIKARKLLNE